MIVANQKTIKTFGRDDLNCENSFHNYMRD